MFLFFQPPVRVFNLIQAERHIINRKLDIVLLNEAYHLSKLLAGSKQDSSNIADLPKRLDKQWIFAICTGSQNSGRCYYTIRSDSCQRLS